MDQHSNGIHDRTVEGITECLSVNSSLTELRLNSLRVNEAARRLPVQGLGVNTSLVRLALGESRGISDPDYDDFEYGVDRWTAMPLAQVLYTYIYVCMHACMYVYI